jgi:hypothetical protein
MAGTASPHRRWLLVEHPGPWALTALASQGVSSAREALAAAVSTSGGRLLLVRRHGRRTSEGPRRWTVLGHAGGLLASGTWSDDGSGRPDAGLLAAATALAAGSGTSQRPDEPTQLPLLLVCAHGRHDVCCAVRGRPVAATLAERWPEQTWECSHVGGDRFAANLVIVPDGVYYGGLDAVGAVDVVDRHLAGRVDVEHLRGFTTMPPAAQAVAVEAHRRWGPAGPRSLAVSEVRQTAENRWHVELSGVDALPSRVVADVVRVLGAPTRLTCRATHDAVPGWFEVIALASSHD